MDSVFVDGDDFVESEELQRLLRQPSEHARVLIVELVEDLL